MRGWSFTLLTLLRGDVACIGRLGKRSLQCSYDLLPSYFAGIITFFNLLIKVVIPCISSVHVIIHLLDRFGWWNAYLWLCLLRTWNRITPKATVLAKDRTCHVLRTVGYDTLRVEKLWLGGLFHGGVFREWWHRMMRRAWLLVVCGPWLSIFLSV